MATAEQLKSLIKSHFQSNPEMFNTIALQIAATEARIGHVKFANQIRIIVEKNKDSTTKIINLSPDLQDLILTNSPRVKIGELIVSSQLLKRIERIIREYQQKEKILKFGLTNRRKILLAGSPGTGKTMTASIIASELKLPLYTVLMDKLMTKFMGETSAKLRLVFDFIKQNRGVYLFDEFDAIGGERGKENEVGELRRVLNSFLQFIEQDESESFIISATNSASHLDKALFRRFDDIIQYNKPDEEQIEKLIKNRLGFFQGKFSAKNITKHAINLSHAEITQACNDAIKEAILADKKLVTKSLLIKMLEERHIAYGPQ